MKLSPVGLRAHLYDYGRMALICQQIEPSFAPLNRERVKQKCQPQLVGRIALICKVIKSLVKEGQIRNRP